MRRNLALALFISCLSSCVAESFHSIVYRTAEPFRITIGYTKFAAPNVTVIGGMVAPAEFVCHNVRKLLPDKKCIVPKTLKEMTRFDVASPPRGYTRRQLEEMAAKLPYYPSTLKMLFVDGPSPNRAANARHWRPGPLNSELVIIYTAEINANFEELNPRNTTDTTEWRERRNLYEAKIVVHEIGHALGLVNLGVPEKTRHRHPYAKHHCRNVSCVMHYGVKNVTSADFTAWKARHRAVGWEADVVFDGWCIEDIQTSTRKK